MEELTSIGLNLDFLFSRRQNKRFETKEKTQCQPEYPTLVDFVEYLEISESDMSEHLRGWSLSKFMEEWQALLLREPPAACIQRA